LLPLNEPLWPNVHRNKGDNVNFAIKAAQRKCSFAAAA
jgi:hypothetical protein